MIDQCTYAVAMRISTQCGPAAQTAGTPSDVEARLAWMGITVQQREAKSDAAVVVTDVKSGGNGERAGLRVGDVIRAVTLKRADSSEGRSITTPRDLETLVAMMRPGDRLQLRIERDGRPEQLSFLHE